MNPPEFVPTPVSRLREQVERQLRDAIASGGLSEGDRLPPEADLAERFGVSRGTLREALMSLVSAGLVVRQAGGTGGTFVGSLDTQDLGEKLANLVALFVGIGKADHSEVVEVRTHLEVPAAGMAAENRTDGDVIDLRRIVALQESRLTGGTPDAGAENADFHYAIAVASQNQLLAALIHALNTVTRKPIRIGDLALRSRQHKIDDHRQLVEAIAAGDRPLAERLMREHLLFVRDLRPLAVGTDSDTMESEDAPASSENSALAPGGSDRPDSPASGGSATDE